MTTHFTDISPGGAAVGLPATELERLVLAADRPCIENPGAWFPDEPDGRRPRARERFEARARTLCRSCPVAIECLELTIQREGPARGYGVAGGTASWERQDIKRARGWRVPGRTR